MRGFIARLVYHLPYPLLYAWRWLGGPMPCHDAPAGAYRLYWVGRWAASRSTQVNAGSLTCHGGRS